MTKFLHSKFSSITPYNTSGDKSPKSNLIRLNTNENPFPPSKKSIEYALQASHDLNFYGDPECVLLTKELANLLRVNQNEILFGNGSDEILNFIFMGFCENGVIFPDITYSFYEVLANFYNLNYTKIPLKNFRIDLPDYYDYDGKTIVFANPNAPTGLTLNQNEIEKIILHNKNSLIIIDEAYVDFSGKSCVELVKKYDNLIIIRTFSKSRSMAGARLGFCVACENLINDLRNIKNSIAPYNVNSMTQAAGIGVLKDEDYTQKNIKIICVTRDKTKKQLEELNFEVLDSSTNFLFAKHESLSGEKIYSELLKQNILIRHFRKPEQITNFNRITIGTPEQMQKMIDTLKEIIKKGVY